MIIVVKPEDQKIDPSRSLHLYKQLYKQFILNLTFYKLSSFLIVVFDCGFPPFILFHVYPFSHLFFLNSELRRVHNPMISENNVRKSNDIKKSRAK